LAEITNRALARQDGVGATAQIRNDALLQKVLEETQFPIYNNSIDSLEEYSYQSVGF
jgi:hypothetical protein